MNRGCEEIIKLGRPDLVAMASMIPEGARILDLGCGGGEFLRIMSDAKRVRGAGVEIDQDKILECAKRGVNVVHADLDSGLTDFLDHSYDYVILSRTFQAVRRPDQLLSEMLRVGSKGIVSFINIGHFPARVHLLFGDMPVTKNLPEPWYKTSNIHLGTIADFKALCKKMGIRIEREVPVAQHGDSLSFLARLWPNLFASTCVFMISK